MATAAEQSPLEDLLGHLRGPAGLHTQGFSRSSVVRAVRRRALDTANGDLRLYRERLESDRDELARLGHEVIVRYTCFFRDAPEWQWLSEHVVAPLLAGRRTRPITIWSAGCASGEEAYSVAILFAEALGSMTVSGAVQVVGTDTDDTALAQARSATYAGDEMAGVPPRLRRRYFVSRRGAYEVRSELADAVEFEFGDITRDDFGRPADLIVCRHTLMYLGGRDRHIAVARFHAALSGAGRLWLESTDDLAGHESSFEPLEPGRPVFAKNAAGRAPAANRGERDGTFPPTGGRQPCGAHGDSEAS